MRSRAKRTSDTLPAVSDEVRAADRVERGADEIARQLLDPREPSPVAMMAAAPTGQRAAPGAGGGTQLPDATREFFEQRLGQRLDDVRIRTDASANREASALGARAFVHGNSISFGRGEYAPGEGRGRELLAHELAHVAQVRAGQADPAGLHRQPVAAPQAVAGNDPQAIHDQLLALMCRRFDTRAIVERIQQDHITILLFDTAFDNWRMANGTVQENELPGLRGNTCITQGGLGCPQGRTIRLRRSLSIDDMMMTLFHEMQHWIHSQTPGGPSGLDSEIQARVASEQLAIDSGRPPTRPNYRTADGRVDEPAIRAEINASPHYNPTGRTRIGRRYVNEVTLPGEWVCPPIGDFPDPGRVRGVA